MSFKSLLDTLLSFLPLSAVRLLRAFMLSDFILCLTPKAELKHPVQTSGLLLRLPRQTERRKVGRTNPKSLCNQLFWGNWCT